MIFVYLSDRSLVANHCLGNLSRDQLNYAMELAKNSVDAILTFSRTVMMRQLQPSQINYSSSGKQNLP
jgi:hypothetical protein